ncbi:MAG TPA: hypothetical protein VMH04_24495 [Candidatus Solibacter sp.]|nr:hypothetical protein [Candidatus Solibacter sp.]
MKLWHAVAYLNLVVLAADHLLTGLAGVFFPRRAAGLYKRLFGAQFPSGSPIVAVLQPWGALGVFAGVTGLLPLLDAARYRAVLFALLLLVVLRIFIRLGYDAATLQFFGLSRRRNLFHVYLVSQCAAIIALQLLWW